MTSYRLALNQFSDMTLLEYSRIFQNNYNNFALNRNSQNNLSNNYNNNTATQNTTITIPELIDWREKGAITPVRDQGNQFFFSIIYKI